MPISALQCKFLLEIVVAIKTNPLHQQDDGQILVPTIPALNGEKRQLILTGFVRHKNTSRIERDDPQNL